MQAIRRTVNNPLNYYLLNAYFYNNHDLKLMIKWAKNAGNPWEHMIFLYKRADHSLNTVLINTPSNSNEFSIPSLPNSYWNYPIKAVLVPNLGYGKEDDIRHLSVYRNEIGEKQIFW